MLASEDNKVMKYIKYILAVFLCVSVVHSAELNLVGKLHTKVGTLYSDVTVSYDAAGAVPFLETPFSIVNPSNGDLEVGVTLRGITWTSVDDADFPEWPGLVLKNDDPFSLDFVVMDPLPDVWRLGASGIITHGEIQLFVDTYDGVRFGTAGAPVPAYLLPSSVPEPRQYALLAGLCLMAMVFVRRRR